MKTTLEKLLAKGYAQIDRAEGQDSITGEYSKQVVLFDNGYVADYLDGVLYSKQMGGFVLYDDNGNKETKHGKRCFVSNILLQQPTKKRSYKKQTDISKMKEIKVDYETEKAYAVFAGDNGYITPEKHKDFYKFYAKSICVVENGKVYAPIWAK